MISPRPETKSRGLINIYVRRDCRLRKRFRLPVVGGTVDHRYGNIIKTTIDVGAGTLSFNRTTIKNGYGVNISRFVFRFFFVFFIVRRY